MRIRCHVLTNGYKNVQLMSFFIGSCYFWFLTNLDIAFLLLRMFLVVKSANYSCHSNLDFLWFFAPFIASLNWLSAVESNSISTWSHMAKLLNNTQVKQRLWSIWIIPTMTKVFFNNHITLSTSFFTVKPLENPHSSILTISFYQYLRDNIENQ
jgi:hypothetical protein